MKLFLGHYSIKISFAVYATHSIQGVRKFFDQILPLHSSNYTNKTKDMET